MSVTRFERVPYSSFCLVGGPSTRLDALALLPTPMISILRLEDLWRRLAYRDCVRHIKTHPEA